MKFSKKSFITCLLAALVALSAAPASAQILLQPSGDYRDKLTRCNNWWECYKEKVIEQEKEKAAEPLTIVPPPLPEANPVLLPNLIPTDVDSRIWGSSVEIKAQVDNIGDADALNFDIRADVTFVRGDTGAVVRRHTVQTFVSVVRPGGNWDNVIDYISPPDRDYDYDVTTTVYADSTNWGSGGAVWESNESDNTLTRTCRIFGNASGQGNLGSHPAC